MSIFLIRHGETLGNASRTVQLPDSQLSPRGAAQAERLARQMGVLYDLALSYHHRVMNREHILQSLAPLYMGRVASFVGENITAAPAAVEDGIEKLCRTFEEQKPYLIESW